MNKLEQKIHTNKAILDEKFLVKNVEAVSNDMTKTGFSDGWNNGWSNHGGPGKSQIKYGFSKGWDKGWSNHGGPAWIDRELSSNS
jgi:hypothetical protein